ncbi:hypothetical protein FisN_18Lh050 [Fistulifera solaris]|uniref:Uncharacterized protein n=1 Tax=Fistulifera solaris TaxID=1519565 RepID=A0A1Z5KE48_FISSO|nr:hypothetical protein FisN_18Lh050 [Fistulifera solaris]|eukprot:GAX24497.1 hypothetical protein FisN_18Lh050 [Fistulifera solaris]
MPNCLKFLIYSLAFSALWLAQADDDNDRNRFQRSLQLTGVCDPIPPGANPRVCRTVIGTGICLDANGENFNACFKYGGLHGFTKTDCRDVAEANGKAVGWQYGAVGLIPRVCVLFFDEVDVDGRVTNLCPSDFSQFGLSGRLGTGFPKQTADGIFECYSCE